MCISIRSKIVAVEHQVVYKNVRIVDGKFMSRYVPNKRIFQDEVGLHESGWYNDIGTDVEYKVGLMTSPAPGLYGYMKLNDALRDSDRECFATLEAIIPRGANVWTGAHFGYDAFISSELIILRQVK